MSQGDTAKNIVVVLGSGRSGTSLLMQVLVGLGLRVSSNLVLATHTNPDGFYEDREIVEAHKTLFHCLSASQSMPLDEGWINAACVNSIKDILIELVLKNVDGPSSIWGFKDPRTSTVLPLWFKVFNSVKVIPRYILAVRDPCSSIGSMIKQSQNRLNQDEAELIWLLRNLEAIENTSADFYLIHYEDWFKSSTSIVRDLIGYTGLSYDLSLDANDVLNCVNSRRDHSSSNDIIINNASVEYLYAALKDCQGADFDRKSLMTAVRHCRKDLSIYKNWYQLAHQANKKLADTQARLEKANAEAAKVKGLEAQIKDLEKDKAQSALLATQVHRLERQLNQLMGLDAL